MKRILFQAEARTELDKAVAYYEKRRAGLGLDLQGEIEQTVREIQRVPGMGAPYKQAEFRYSLVRRFSYVIYYLELSDAIWIVAVAHDKRRPGYWRRRRIEGESSGQVP